MNSLEIKNLILEVYKEETTHLSNINELRKRYYEQSKSLNEGILDSLSIKIIEILVTALKKISPEMYDKIDKAVKEKNKPDLDSILNDPKVKQAEKEISGELVSEGIKDIIPNIINWIKTHKVTTGYIALGLITAIIGMMKAHGNPSEFMMLYWPKLQIGSIGGTIGGALVQGIGSLYKQKLSKGGMDKVDWKQVGKDTLKGAGQGLVAGTAASGLAGVGASIAGAAGTATAAMPSLIKFLETQPDGKDTFEMIYKHKDDSNYPYLKKIKDKIEQWKKWIDDPDNALEPDDLNQKIAKQYLLKLLQGKISDSELEKFNRFMERQGTVNI
jgi:hypothetical protein